jgi:SAM-dependent methyltransferase
MESASSDAIRRPFDRMDANCRICGARGVVILPFRYLFQGRSLYGVRCDACAIIFVEPQPSRDEIAGMYDEGYFTECSDTVGAHGRDAYMEMAETSEAERLRAAARMDARVVRYATGRGRFLEVGCGPGFFLEAIRRQGWDVQGLEISSFAVTHAVERLGLPVIQGSVEIGVFPEGSFDAVFLGDVLEHLPDPRASLAILKSWLKPGGVLVVAVPSTMNLLSAKLGLTVYRAKGGFKTLRIPPYHLFEYTPRSLRGALERSGLEVVEIRQSAVPLGRMGLRGTPLENAGKVSLQAFARVTARLLNSGGDRLTALALRPRA